MSNSNTEIQKIKNNEKAKKMREKYKQENRNNPKDPFINKKTCNGPCCNGKEKVYNDFAINLGDFTGRANKCKECMTFIASKKANTNKEKLKSIDVEKVTKKCTGKCGNILPLNLFDIFYANGNDGHVNICKTCKSAERKTKINSTPLTEGTKFCMGCLQDKQVCNFSIDTYSEKTGLQTYCKDCRKIQGKLYYSKLTSYLKKIVNDARQRCKLSKHLNREISCEVTVDDIFNIFKFQNGLCALTGIELTYTAMTERDDSSNHILNPLNMSIDRVDPDIGYTLNNVRLVCAIVNKIKWTMFDEDLLILCHNIDVTTNLRNFDAKYEKMFNTKFTMNKTIQPTEYITNLAQKRVADASYNAKKKKFDCKFEITKDDIIQKYIEQQGRCYLSGQLFSTDSKIGKKYNNLSIDRIDSKKGYTKDNVQLVTEIVNHSKSDLSNDEYIKWCRKIKNGFHTGHYINRMK